MSIVLGLILLGTLNEFELAMVSESSEFEPLKFYCILTLKAPIMAAADNIHKYFSEKKYLIFHINPLLAEDSHETSSLISLER